MSYFLNEFLQQIHMLNAIIFGIIMIILQLWEYYLIGNFKYINHISKDYLITESLSFPIYTKHKGRFESVFFFCQTFELIKILMKSNGFYYSFLPFDSRHSHFTISYSLFQKQ